MVNSINLIAFGTFGNPNGFKQTFFVGNKDLSKSVKTFDLNTNAIKLFINSKVYAIRKENANGFNTIAYSLYTYAKEPNSDRSGTFIGSSILYTNKIAEEHITLTQLNEFHNQLVNKNLSNETISVNHSDKFSVVKPKDFDKIEFHLREIENLNFRQITDNYLVVFCNINDNNLIQFFANSIDLLNVYDTIYFTDNKQVAEFVHQKGVFKLIQNVGEKKDFEKEINNLIEERKRIREQSISEFEREVQIINDDKGRTIQEFKTQIEQSERIHLDNERKLRESKEDINKIGQFYDDFLNKTRSLINQLRNNNGKLEEAKQIHNSNKILFNSGVSELKRPHYTTTIAKPKPKGNLNIEHQHQDYDIRSGQRKRSYVELDGKSHKINRYKVATFVLGFLLLITWIYLLYTKLNSPIKTEIIQNQEQLDIIHQEEVQTPNKIIKELKPSPNSKLNDNDCKIISKNIKYKSKIEDIVKVIFDNNPTEVKSIYNGQEVIYSKNLFELNKQCFEEKDGNYYYIKDTIKHIPSFKKKL